MKLSLDINTDFEVTTLTDLPKLKIVMENLNMKINKSEIARHMDVDRRTVDKYLNGFEPTKKRNRQSIID
ncbi:IS21 family transposase, partial [Staphylococcus aureus]